MFLALLEMLSLVDALLVCSDFDSSYLATTLGYSCFFTEIIASLPNFVSSGYPCKNSSRMVLALVKVVS